MVLTVTCVPVLLFMEKALCTETVPATAYVGALKSMTTAALWPLVRFTVLCICAPVVL